MNQGHELDDISISDSSLSYSPLYSRHEKSDIYPRNNIKVFLAKLLENEMLKVLMEAVDEACSHIWHILTM